MELTESELKHIEVIDNYSNLLYKQYNHFVFHKDFNTRNRLKVISGMIKPESNGEQFGYLHNRQAGILYVLIKRLQKTSLIDLGSGAGLLLACLKSYDAGLKLEGIEIEDELIDIARKLDITTRKKGLLLLETGDIKDFEIVYFWEPFHQEEACKNFVNRLVNCIRPGQTLIMRPSGKIIETLLLNKNIQALADPFFNSDGEYKVFMKFQSP